MAAAVSQNISNAGTPGYRRVDIVTSEMNFSGPGGVPFAPGGVSTSVRRNDQPWLDGRLQMATSQNAGALGYQNALADFAGAADTSWMEQSFSDFMATSQDALMNPTNSEVIARLQASLGGFVMSVNQFEERVNQSLDRLQQQQGFIAQELSVDGLDPARNLELQGELQGISRAMNGPIQDILSDINNILSAAESDINSAYGIDIVGRDDNNGRMTSNFQEGGDFQGLTEYGSQGFNTDLGATQSALGVALQSAQNNLRFASNERDAAMEAWDAAYGVDITQEAIKLREIEIYQQANAMVMRTASEMMGTVINIMA